MKRLEGKVAFITGAARGQGRAHAVEMAREGADVIAVDICRELPELDYGLAEPDDLAETARLVSDLGRRVIVQELDCRDGAAVRAAADEGAAELGGLDIGVINHGIFKAAAWDETTDSDFGLVIDTNLKSVWYAATAVVPHLIARGGGALTMTASSTALRPGGHIHAYAAAKAGVVALAKSLAIELGRHHIRVNAICPGSVPTQMILNHSMMQLFAGGSEGSPEQMADVMQQSNLLPVPWVDPEAVAAAAVYLSSDDGRFITGTAFPVDAGELTTPAGIPEPTARRLGELQWRLRNADVRA